MDVQAIRKFLDSTKGKIFGVTFIKKDGSIREMQCRTNVTRDLKGGVAGHAHIPELYTVYDMKAQGYRSINLLTLLTFKMGKIVVDFREEV